MLNSEPRLIEGMRERKFGRIVNISSINGQKGQMGQTNYSAAKAGEIAGSGRENLSRAISWLTLLRAGMVGGRARNQS
jgi:acetoacetyl-CoA reductase